MQNPCTTIRSSVSIFLKLLRYIFRSGWRFLFLHCKHRRDPGHRWPGTSCIGLKCREKKGDLPIAQMRQEAKKDRIPNRKWWVFLILKKNLLGRLLNICAQLLEANLCQWPGIKLETFAGNSLRNYKKVSSRSLNKLRVSWVLRGRVRDCRTKKIFSSEKTNIEKQKIIKPRCPITQTRLYTELKSQHTPKFLSWAQRKAPDDMSKSPKHRVKIGPQDRMLWFDSETKGGRENSNLFSES